MLTMRSPEPDKREMMPMRRLKKSIAIFKINSKNKITMLMNSSGNSKKLFNIKKYLKKLSIS